MVTVAASGMAQWFLMGISAMSWLQDDGEEDDQDEDVERGEETLLLRIEHHWHKPT